ncbi:MAG: ion transporter, partial [Mangrovicoccus sp.]
MIRRDALGAWLDQPKIRNFILIVILVNAVVLGLETSNRVMDQFGWVIRAIDMACLAVFITEILAKLYAH